MNNSYIEEQMEIDEVEEIRKVREQFGSDEKLPDITFPKDYYCELSSGKEKSYLIVDTNIYLNGTAFIKDIFSSPNSDKLTLVIPWAVVQEIDHFKNIRKNIQNPKLRTLQVEATKCVQMFNSWLKPKKSNIFFQTSADSNKVIPEIQIESNDDKILQCCIQIMKSSLNLPSVHLLTEDKHLRNKAMILQIEVFNKKDFCKYYDKQIAISPQPQFHKKSRPNFAQDEYKLNNLENTTNSNNQLQSDIIGSDNKRNNMCNTQSFDSYNVSNNNSPLKKVKELIKDVMKIGFGKLLRMELEREYNLLWESVVFIQPPWTHLDVLKCIKKHWISLFGDIWPRNYYDEVDNLINLYKNLDKDSKFMIYSSLDDFIDNMMPDSKNLNFNKYLKLKNQMVDKMLKIKSELRVHNIFPKGNANKNTNKITNFQTTLRFSHDKLNSSVFSTEQESDIINDAKITSNLESIKEPSIRQIESNDILSSKVKNNCVTPSFPITTQLNKIQNSSYFENTNIYASLNVNKSNKSTSNTQTMNSSLPVPISRPTKRKLHEEPSNCLNIEKKIYSISDNKIAYDIPLSIEYMCPSPICNPISSNNSNSNLTALCISDDIKSKKSNSNSTGFDVESSTSSNNMEKAQIFDDEVMTNDYISYYLDIIWNSIITDGTKMLEGLKNCGAIYEKELLYNFCAAVNQLIVAAHNYFQKKLISENELKTFCKYLKTFHFKYTKKKKVPTAPLR